jgi:acyl-coenzyme A synthetase/AMP-(fatty) acid ligase
MAAEKIERVLLSFPNVHEAAVFMAATPSGVEEVRAGIVCSDKIDLEVLRAYCRPHIPPPLVPAHIVMLPKLPTSAAGKVDRPRLKQMLMDPASAPL